MSWIDRLIETEDRMVAEAVARERRRNSELMLLAASDLESWMKSHGRDAATEHTVKRLRDAALGVAPVEAPSSDVPDFAHAIKPSKPWPRNAGVEGIDSTTLSTSPTDAAGEE